MSKVTCEVVYKGDGSRLGHHDDQHNDHSCKARTTEHQAGRDRCLRVSDSLGTVLSFPLPPPLFELTWAPAIYLALAAVTTGGLPSPRQRSAASSGSSTTSASRQGARHLSVRMVWARGPRRSSWRGGQQGRQPMARFSMVLATSTRHWPFTSRTPSSMHSGSSATAVGQPERGLRSRQPRPVHDGRPRLHPLALGIAYAAKPAFRRLGFR